MAYAKTIDGIVAISSTQIDDSWVAVTSLPEDKLFRSAYVLVGDEVVTDLPLAKEIAHDKRRAKRDAAYKSVDGGSQYIVVSAEGEAKRKSVKTPDDAEQVAIDATNTVEELRELINASYPAS